LFLREANSGELREAVNSQSTHCLASTGVLVPSTDSRVRSLRKVLIDRLEIDRLIDTWKAAQ